MRRSPLAGACAVLALGAIGLGAVPAGARVSHPHRSVVAAKVNGAAAPDGDHLVAWGNGTGSLRLFDDRFGTRGDIALGPACERPYAIDASHALFLVGCRVNGLDGTETHQLVVDSSSGEITPLVGSTYNRIGRYWGQGRVDTGDHEDIVYEAWRSGETRLLRAPRSGQIYTPFDLDTPDLEPIALAGPQFVTGDSMALEQVRVRRGYAIHLIGPTTDRVVHRAARRSELLSVKGGLALWRRGGRLFGYDIRGRRALEWGISASTVVRGSTRRRVYLLTPKLSSPLFSALRSFAWR
jgi:hypothetical protein